MNQLIILLAVAIALMVLMFIFKAVEIKSNKDLIPRTFRKKTDSIVLYVWHTVFGFIYIVSKKIFHGIVGIPKIISHLFEDIWDFMRERGSKYVDAVKGKKNISKKGSASFFISAVAEYKKELKKDLHK